jgi:hypothetical protein
MEFPVSATYRLPAESIAKPLGSRNSAAAPEPSDEPSTPVAPATKVAVPDTKLTLWIVLLTPSLTYKSPAESSTKLRGLGNTAAETNAVIVNAAYKTVIDRPIDAVRHNELSREFINSVFQRPVCAKTMCVFYISATGRKSFLYVNDL